MLLGILILPLFILMGCQRKNNPAGLGTHAAGSGTKREVSDVRRPSMKVVSETAELMGTIAQIQIWTGRDSEAREASQMAFEEMRRLERIFSNYNPESELSRINSSNGDEIQVSAEMAELIRISQEISRKTQGAFDITVLPLAQLWKKNMKEGRLPDPNDIYEQSQRVGYDNILLSKNLLRFLKKGVKLDFGGIAKGYAVDKASLILRRRGFQNFVVSISGDIFVSGKKGLEKWKIGIQNPRIDHELFKILNVENLAVSTSGDYEQYLDMGDKRFHHLIDPRTGYPAEGCISVTVIASTATLADAYATSFFVLGPDHAEKILHQNPGVKCMMLVKDGDKIHCLSLSCRKD